MTGDVSITATTVWDIGASGGAEWPNRPAELSGVDFTADGRLVSTRDGATIDVTDVVSAERLQTLGTDSVELAGFDVSGDGTAVAAVPRDGPPWC